jgi:hypothetical protein
LITTFNKLDRDVNKKGACFKTYHKKLRQMPANLKHKYKPIGLAGYAVFALVSSTMIKAEPLIEERNFIAFSNSEEELTGLNQQSPFLPASKLICS